MADFKEELPGIDNLSALGSLLDQGRKRLLNAYKDQYLINAFVDSWNQFNQRATGEALDLPQMGGLEKSMCKIYQDTLRDERERSLWGFNLGGAFYWGDIEIGDRMQATVDKICVGGKTICSSPPQYFELLNNPIFKADDGRRVEMVAMIHSHPPHGPSFFSQAELPGFEHSNYARKGGLVGLISTFNVCMIRGGRNGQAVKVYPLTTQGKFRFATEEKAWILINDLFDDSFFGNTRDQLVQTAYGKTS